jgi:hypothetical protein
MLEDNTHSQQQGLHTKQTACRRIVQKQQVQQATMQKMYAADIPAWLLTTPSKQAACSGGQALPDAALLLLLLLLLLP